MTPQLTPEQRVALDGESGVATSPRELGIEPGTSMVESCLDPGLCDYVASVSNPTGARMGAATRAIKGAVGWRCGLTMGHDDDHYLDRPPGFDIGNGEGKATGEARSAGSQPTTDGNGTIPVRGYPLD